METKHELHPDLKDVSLEKVCEMANNLHTMLANRRSEDYHNRCSKAFDLSYMLEYLRLNFDLVPKK